MSEVVETTRSLYALLRTRYEQGKYVTITEAPRRNGGGGWCDFVAIGVWLSTGNKIIGHEVKATRSDWLREVQQPEKSEQFIPYCDKWYIVAPKDIVKPDEMRATWGLIEMSKNRKAMKIKRQAEPNKSRKPLNQNMMASWFRKLGQRDESEIARKVNERLDAERKYRESQTTRSETYWEKEHQSLRQEIDDFESRSGIRINRWNSENVAEAVKLLTRSKPQDIVARYLALHAQLEAITKMSADVADYFSRIEPTEDP